MADARVLRGRQDYTNWKVYGTAAVWSEITENPPGACEVLCQHVSKLGAINPSEPSCASLASGVALATYGASCAALSDDELDRLYKKVKATAYLVLTGYIFC